jgi:hypothetical protein
MERFHHALGVADVEVSWPSVTGEKWVGMSWRQFEEDIIGGGR